MVANSIFTKLSNIIRYELDKGHNKFVIYPFGQYGIEAKHILEEQFGIYDAVYVDKYICKYNSNVYPISKMAELGGIHAYYRV